MMIVIPNSLGTRARGTLRCDCASMDVNKMVSTACAQIGVARLHRIAC